MTLKLVTLFGELDIPNLAFSRFLPSRKDPIIVTVNRIQFNLFVPKDKSWINQLNAPLEDEIHKYPYIRTAGILAEFTIRLEQKDLDLLEKNKEPKRKDLVKYREAMSILRKKLWDFSRHELGQQLQPLSMSHKPEIPLWKELADGRLKYLKSENSEISLTAIIPNGISAFNRNDIRAFQTFLDSQHSTDLAWHALMNSYKHLNRGEKRIAIVEAVIALERALKTKLIDKLKAKNVEGIDKLFKETGLTAVVKYVLPLLVNKHNIPRDLLEVLSEALIIRNNIIHQSQFKIESTKARSIVNAIKQTLDILMCRHLVKKQK